MKELQKKVINITLKGTQEFMGKQIPVITGGFGEDNRVITAKEVAIIHNTELKEINQSIKRLIDKNRIKENIHYIDMMVNEELKVTASDLGLITSNSQKNCFILSERGYSSLIKYMDDDDSWEIHDKLIDDYFALRENFKQQSNIPVDVYSKLSPELKAIFSIDAKQQEQEQRLSKLENDMPLFNCDCKELQDLVKKKGTETLGGYKSPAYNDKSTRSKVYSDIQNQLRREFGVNKYERIKHSQFELAKQIVNQYKVPIVLEKEIQVLNSQMTL